MAASTVTAKISPSSPVNAPSQSWEKHVERVTTPLSEEDMDALIEATTAAIIDGGVFNWRYPPGRLVLERFFEGLLLVPERELFVVRHHDGIICGAALLAHPAFRSELHSPKACLSALFIAPYARGQGLGEALITVLLERARKHGAKVVNCELRENQQTDIQLLTRLGFCHWGTHPYYARIGGQTVRGLFFSKLLVNDQEAVQWQPADKPTSSPHTSHSPTPKREGGLTLYPAIDLKGGACVRLRQGEMDHATHYSDNPPAQAQLFAEAGCRHLHVVDLDGAFAGHSANVEAVEKIIASTSLPVQLGGGLRDMRTIERWLNAGVSRVILGSAAVKDPDLVRQAARAWPGRVVAGIDARQGRVATEGWAEVSELTAIDLAKRMEEAGVAGIIFTEISRDGMLEGLDLDQTAELARHVSIPVIASGGVGTLEHLKELRLVARDVPGIKGVIIGRALYDGRISLPEALDVLEGPC
ncbi:1-(5-phosphoribosyl)-5-[(5-phosphoribosylamino)methylideneamino]imidazole-4-carboxamide isomerase [Saccharibacter sp. 17.LH.SD]|uniref:1-(5-phosphoribosyl)-5-[(5- phosphoribosylamino)methylideneamino]imidazole-4- carboxamide isomerase n=1 Tax=Saccharibacter sp. 17.LH.SD TaxID=2689393 RepID=UPI00136CC834|nr:1-(5-phosphoribosyl)-5-[(5-phosphoribosylamino)methylideneamino]imidazole-4-carboxamide isomerase [Saccharibacter sp. 17.LH.SD]MXV44939.1 1-(5-phosphoribosyl)-5-[(5-phosphoribosylamino)methylideneamino]imidazole-4-carboxamide isomerase [Saccharibacter sp. 17.LH.SD]